MSIAIETSYVLKVDGAPVWKIPLDVLKHVDGEMFIRLRPWDFSLVRLVLHGTDDSIKKKENPSLAQTPGWQAFMILRNEAAFPCDTADVSARSLFGVDAQKKRRRQTRVSVQQLVAQRANCETMEFEVPGDNQRPAMVVRALKPALPYDEMSVLFNADTIDHIIAYIKQGGELDAEALLNKRVYKRQDPPLDGQVTDEGEHTASPCMEDIDAVLRAT